MKPPRVSTPVLLLMPAIIVYAKGTYYFDCSIRDLSDEGARIAVPRNAQFPSSFYLIDVKGGMAHDVRMVRRAGSEVGVNFVRTIVLGGTREPALDFLWRLWSARMARP